MADNVINIFTKGVYNLIDDENIPSDAAQDSQNWITQDGKLKLAYGRALIGAEGAAGKVYGLHWGYKVDGTKVFYRKIDTKVQYLNGSTWTDILTGLTSGAEYSFANYSSLAGAFTFINGVDGYWKINNANPASAIQMYNSAKNFHGKIIIDSGRTILWDRNDTGSKDKTGVYGSYIDTQLVGTQYTAVTSEAIGSSGSTVYSGTLAFKAGGSTRNCFGVSITATVAAGTETFTDNFNGVLTSNYGGTGTINYATGAYSVTFSATTTGAVTSNYTWEDSNAKGVTDFTKSATRVAGEGFQFPQDEGGDAILNILIGQDGAYYSLKKQSSFRLYIDQTDTMGSETINKVYRKDIGIPNWRAAVSTNKGIVFINTANPDKPELTILQKNPIGDSVEPVILFPNFKFANYIYDDCCIDTWERYIVVACRTSDSIVNNIILLCDIAQGTVDISKYSARIFAKDSGNLYSGSSVTQSVYNIFNGFDDDGYPVDNFWIGKGEQYSKVISEKLKKFRKLRIKGTIDPDQVIEIYISYDDAGFELVGTIRGDASYVDYTDPQVIGSNMIGEAQIGGDDIAMAYPFFAEFKLKPPKFRKRTIKFVATEIGYVDIDTIIDWDILLFEQRIPKRFRQKQNVSIDGADVNQ